ncbi:HAD family hydrolase [Oceanospirillum maris]|uniref:HAD family hydrolase n=1 Tax=Oceanospirillum maris TaxID=64977 RepID=UPI00040AF044|nr:HAD family hydrolase [Oceanospirillum maris]
MKQDLYVFDMDDTLIQGDCAMIWNTFLVEKGFVDSSGLTAQGFLEQDKVLMALYSEGKMGMEEYLAFSLSPVLGLSKAQIQRLVDECITQKILPNAYPEALALIQQLKNKGQDMLVISATVSFIVKPVAKALGIDEALGIDLVETDTGYTSTISGVASYREGKVQRLNQWLDSAATGYKQIHFYTDSINDLPLCLHADQIYLVNPCSRLLAKAKPEWQVYRW